MPSDSFWPTATVIPDGPGFWPHRPSDCATCSRRPDAYRLGPADRLASLLEAAAERRNFPRTDTSSSILTTVWADELSEQPAAIGPCLPIELIRANKRIWWSVLIIRRRMHSRNYRASYESCGLMYKTWVSRYEMALAQQVEEHRDSGVGVRSADASISMPSRAQIRPALRRKLRSIPRTDARTGIQGAEAKGSR